MLEPVQRCKCNISGPKQGLSFFMNCLKRLLPCLVLVSHSVATNTEQTPCGEFEPLLQQQGFERSRPESLEPGIFETFASKFSRLQEISSFHKPRSNVFGAQLVENALISGPFGQLWNALGNSCSPDKSSQALVSPINPPEPRTPNSKAFQLSTPTVSLIQQHAWMYYHFLCEQLPRLAALVVSEAIELVNDCNGKSDVQLGSRLCKQQPKWCNTSVTIVSWGKSWEASFFAALGIPKSSIVEYGDTQHIDAPLILEPTPAESVTPQRELLFAFRSLLRSNFPIETSSRTAKIVYCTRSNSTSRRIANEQEVQQAIESAIGSTSTLELVKFTGSQSLEDSLSLFSDAAAIVGPHGAGLSHIILAPPNTVVVELQFMNSPPMMFYHIANALHMPYAIAPLPHTYWGQSSAYADPHEVVALLERHLPQLRNKSSCAAGHGPTSAGVCVKCAAGSYSASTSLAECKACMRGRVAPGDGMSYCLNCADDEASSSDGKRCVQCANGYVAGGPSDVCDSPFKLAVQLKPE